jgi:hypothetical protein
LCHLKGLFMRKSAVVIVCALLVVLGAQAGSAAPRARLVSPTLLTNIDQRLVCSVVNWDDRAHEFTFEFYDGSGRLVSGNLPQLVAPRGSVGLSMPHSSLPTHCEITADGRAEMFRGSIHLIDITAPVQPTILVALPMW